MNFEFLYVISAPSAVKENEKHVNRRGAEGADIFSDEYRHRFPRLRVVRLCVQPVAQISCRTVLPKTPFPDLVRS